MIQKSIFILLADDHTLFREALTILIKTLIENPVIHEADAAQPVLTKIKNNHYDLIILDTRMAGVSSYQLVADILDIRPEANILMIAMNASEIDAKKYSALGVVGYVGKVTPVEEIKKAIDAIIN